MCSIPYFSKHSFKGYCIDFVWPRPLGDVIIKFTSLDTASVNESTVRLFSEAQAAFLH